MFCLRENRTLMLLSSLECNLLMGSREMMMCLQKMKSMILRIWKP